MERKITLGNKEVPPGLEEGLRGMKVDGERILVLDPNVGFDQKYRYAALCDILLESERRARAHVFTQRMIIRWSA